MTVESDLCTGKEVSFSALHFNPSPEEEGNVKTPWAACFCNNNSNNNKSLVLKVFHSACPLLSSQCFTDRGLRVLHILEFWSISEKMSTIPTVISTVNP